MEIPDIPLNEEGDRFQTVMAILIAAVTLVGAVLAWRTAVAANNAGDADFAGTKATLNVEETLTIDDIDLLRHYRAYTTYTRYQALQDGLAAAGAAPAAAEAADLAAANQIFFPNRYLNRDGSYDSRRELGEIWAQTEQVIDLDPAPHLAAADQYRIKTNRLIGTFIGLALSLFFYTLAEGLHPTRQSWRYTMAIVATLFLMLTIGTAVVVELGIGY